MSNLGDTHPHGVGRPLQKVAGVSRLSKSLHGPNIQNPKFGSDWLSSIATMGGIDPHGCTPHLGLECVAGDQPTAVAPHPMRRASDGIHLPFTFKLAMDYHSPNSERNGLCGKGQRLAVDVKRGGGPPYNAVPEQLVLLYAPALEGTAIVPCGIAGDARVWSVRVVFCVRFFIAAKGGLARHRVSTRRIAFLMHHLRSATPGQEAFRLSARARLDLHAG